MYCRAFFIISIIAVNLLINVSYLSAMTWNISNAGMENNYLNSLAIDITNTQVIYAATLSSGAFRSMDGGANWTAINSGLINESYGTVPSLQAIAIDPNNNQTIYAGTNIGVFKSTNGGMSWNSINTGLTIRSVYSMVIDPTNSQIIYVGTDSSESGKAIFKTTNGGASWGTASAGLNIKSGYGNMLVRDIAIDPNNIQTLYAAVNGIYKSTNGGESWFSLNAGLPYDGVESVAIDPNENQTIYIGISLHGVYKSINGGDSWSLAKSGFGGGYYTKLVIDPFNNQTVYAGTYNGVYKSSDGGLNWITVNSGGPVSTAISALVVDPTNSHIMYAGTTNALFKSINGGLDTFTVTPLFGSKGNVVPSTPQTVVLNSTATLQVTPQKNYTATVSGCNGVTKISDSSINYVTGPINGDCTVTANFNPTLFTVTPLASPGGTIIPATQQTIVAGATASFTIILNDDYSVITPIDGTCPQGTLVGTLYTSGGIVSNCTVAPMFTPKINGVCGTSNNAVLVTAPIENLCTRGSATLVTGNGPWSWDCIGQYGGITAKCTASIGVPLAITFIGNGGGSVNGDISCNSEIPCPSKAFLAGSNVSLLQTPNSQSTFSGWSGDCSGIGNCSFTMDVAKSVAAHFALAPKAMVGAKPFDTLQSAYDDSATMTDSIIKLLEGTLAGTLTAGKDVSVTLDGGYNATYDAISTETTIQGPLTIRAGTIRVKGVNVR